MGQMKIHLLTLDFKECMYGSFNSMLHMIKQIQGIRHNKREQIVLRKSGKCHCKVNNNYGKIVNNKAKRIRMSSFKYY